MWWHKLSVVPALADPQPAELLRGGVSQHLLRVGLVHLLHGGQEVHAEAHLRWPDEGASFRVSESRNPTLTHWSHMTEALMVNYTGTLGLMSLGNNFHFFTCRWNTGLHHGCRRVCLSPGDPTQRRATALQTPADVRWAGEVSMWASLNSVTEWSWWFWVVLGGSGLCRNVLMFSMWCWCSITGLSALSQMLHVVSTHAAVVYPTTDTVLLVCFHYDHHLWVQVHLWFCLCCLSRL